MMPVHMDGMIYAWLSCRRKVRRILRMSNPSSANSMKALSRPFEIVSSPTSPTQSRSRNRGSEGNTWRPCPLLDTTVSHFRQRTMQQPLYRPCLPLVKAVLCFLAAAPLGAHLLIGQSSNASTAWHQGSFHIDRKGVIERSDIILQSPNESPKAAMPLGNGRLGLAVWAQEGYTAQLNRADTFPLRLSPGQVVVPGLGKLTKAGDYLGRLSLYDGEFRQSGGGMTAVTYVTETLDVMVIDVAALVSSQAASLTAGQDRHPRRDMARQPRSRCDR